MFVSICMGIFNGEKFIEQQLLSLLSQTRQPDQVILCDDCSQDGTADIVQKFIHNHRLECQWHLYQNTENKGYPGNFYHAMELCTGDIIFLGDQDDIWETTKLEKMLSALEQYPKANVMACKFGLIDNGGQQIHTVMAPSHSTHTGKVSKVTIHDIFYKYQWPGMVLAYRNHWYHSWAKQPACIPHDIFICAKAAEEGAFFQLDEVLAYHRRHESNTAAEEHRIRRLLHKERKLWEIEKYLQMLKAFETCGVLQTKEGQQALQDKLDTMWGRYEALQSGKISNVLKNALHGGKQVRLATVICDLLIVKGKRRPI